MSGFVFDLALLVYFLLLYLLVIVMIVFFLMIQSSVDGSQLLIDLALV
jgi:hypothetical protein